MSRPPPLNLSSLSSNNSPSRTGNIRSPTLASASSTGAGAGWRNSPVSPALGSNGGSAFSAISAGRREREVVEPDEGDMERFEQLCRELYYDHSPTAGAQIDKLLRLQPPSIRPIFSKIQARIRAQFHADSLADRRSKLRQLLLSTKPEFAPKGRDARTNRYRGLRRWIGRNCTNSLPGTHPFARGLYMALNVQRRSGKGGASERRVEWEVDEAALLEAGGGEWMDDTVHLLKGLLGCSERLVDMRSRPSSAYTTSTTEEDVHSHSHSNELGSSVSSHATVRQAMSFVVPTADGEQGGAQKKKPPPPPPSRRPTRQTNRLPTIASNPSLRSRSDSDPFGDPKEAPINDRPRRPSLLGFELQRQQASDSEETEGASGEETDELDDGRITEDTTPVTTPNTAAPLLSEQQATPPSQSLHQRKDPPRPPPRSLSSLEAHMTPRYYIFTLPPYLTNPELFIRLVLRRSVTTWLLVFVAWAMGFSIILSVLYHHFSHFQCLSIFSSPTAFEQDSSKGHTQSFQYAIEYTALSSFYSRFAFVFSHVQFIPPSSSPHEANIIGLYSPFL
ncbi:hypothetical protein BT69DRAFT_1317140 [Atractiella rhizophila]|nr:hypothetical protein BT69DRAFT_1317140 [Atractiella rhizophila]